jgi:hypothetical protein
MERSAAMNDLRLGAIVSAVQKNCHISDAQFAADLTLCTFLLKMRELYRWENEIPLTEEMPKSEVGDWMNEREQFWEAVEAAPYEPLPLATGSIDPFEVAQANRELAPHGLVYSGGFGRACKPHFFLGSLLREEVRDGFKVYVSGCEFARDLDAPPGMMLDDTIFVRTESLQRWLWEKYEEWNWNHRNQAMSRAVAYYNFRADPVQALKAMTATETESVILHELGEARVGAELGGDWSQMLAGVMRSRAEIMARAVRDLYADCLSTLPGLLLRNNPAAIHFYFANFTGMRRLLFPELAAAYQVWLGTGDSAELHRICSAGRVRWQAMAWRMIELFRQHGDAVGPMIEQLLEQPLEQPNAS